MRGITSLPYELVHEVTKLLNDADDLLALRMTCRDMCEKVKERHLNLMYQTITVYPILASFQSLVKISIHPSRVNSIVKHLQFSISTPCGKTILSKQFCKGSQLISTITGSIEIIDTVTKFAQQHSKSDPRSNNRLGYYNLLTSAFVNLPNLESISFTNTKRLTRSEFNLLYPTLGFGPGTRLPKAPLDVGTLGIAAYENGIKQIWKIIMFACHASSTTSLRTIKDPQNLCPIQTSWFKTCPKSFWAPSPPTFPISVLKLSIYFDHECDRISGWGKERYDSDSDSGIDNESESSLPTWASNLSRWLGHFSRTLTELDLSGLTELIKSRCYGADKLFPLEDSFPMLRKLHLLRIPLVFENFKEFLRQAGKNLRDLQITESGLYFEEHEWFEILKTIRDECLQVQSFKFLLLTHVDALHAQLIMAGEAHPPLYTLPNIQVDGLWQSGNSRCKLDFPQQDYEFIGDTLFFLEGWAGNTKDIGKELDADQSECFWDSLTDGNWRDCWTLNILAAKWRRRYRIYSEWEESVGWDDDDE
ncbi:hypothetical protein AA313_de0206438 [Arthrobotrys entomopaga]|nr:hypothetical protein AA313_de0206438 [Arthrobotrys entomopaga]